MATLYFNQKHLELFGFCPNEDGIWNAKSFVIRGLILFIDIIMDLVPSIVYPILHSDEENIFIDALIPVMGFIVVTMSYITFFVEGKRVIKTFACIRSLVDERNQKGSNLMYAVAEKKSVTATKWPLIVTWINYGSNVIIISGGQVLFDWISGEMHPEDWSLTYKLSYPFNQHTYSGFLLVNIIQTINIFTYFIILTAVPSYFLSICFYLEAICDDFEKVCRDIDNSIYRGFAAIESNFLVAINLEKSLGEIFKDMAKVVSGTIFFQVIGGTIFISAALFQMENTLVRFDVKMVMTIFAGIVGVFAILPYCYYASQMTARIQHVANDIFESRWYELSVHHQKNLKLMIAFAQINRTVDGYGLLNLDLEGFAKIMKTSSSYFLMFRSINE